MTTVAVRLPDDVVAEIDALVSRGTYATRTAAVKRALEVLIEAHAKAAVDEQIVEEYTRRPQSADEIATARAATIALIAEEPW